MLLFTWELLTKFIIPLITMWFIIYSAWNGLEIKTGKIEMEIYPLKRYLKKKE